MFTKNFFKQFFAKIAIAVTILMPVMQVSAASFTYNQGTWTGGAATTTIADPGGRTGWTAYQSASSTIKTSVANQVSLVAVAGSSTQTTDTDFNAGTKTNVVVSGSGDASLGLVAISSANTWYSVTSLPGVNGYRPYLVYDNAGNIYAKSLDSGGYFRRYNIASNTWTALTYSGGNSLTYDNNGNIYSLDSSNLQRYNIASGVWTTTLASAPTSTINETWFSVYDNNGNIYVGGGGGTSFYKYNIASDSWSTSTASLPAASRYGRAAYDNNGNIYLMQISGGSGWGGAESRNLWKYSIASNTWTTGLAIFPSYAYAGGMIYDGNGNLYADRGGYGQYATGGYRDLYKYNIASNTWATMAGKPTISAFSSLVYDNNGNIYETARYDNGVISGAVSKYSIYDNYQGAGTYESATVDLGSGKLLSSLTFNPATQSGGASVQFQIATADATNGPWNYVGPDGTTGTYFTSSEQVTPASLNGHRYMRYKAWLVGAGAGWQTLASLPNTVGGIQYDNKGKVYASGYVYDTASNTWAAGVSNFPAGGGSSDNKGGVYYFSAGKFYNYNGATNIATSVSNTAWPYGAITGTPVTVYDGNGSLYLLGNFTSVEALNRAAKYSIANDAWSLTNASTYLASGKDSAQFINGKIYFLNDDTNGGVYDTSSGATSAWPSGATLLTNGKALVHDGGRNIYITTGSGNANASETLMRYDVASGAISSLLATPVLGSSRNYLTYDSGGNFYALGAPGSTSTPFYKYSTRATASASVTDVTINYTGYSNGSLISSPYDAGDPTNAMASIQWLASVPGSTNVQFQVRVASSSAALANAQWVGPGNSPTAYFTNAAGNDLTFLNANAQWFQYRVILNSIDGINTPIVQSATTTYVINGAPIITGVSVLQIATTTDPDWGKVKINFNLQDVDTTTNIATTTFEYNNGGVWTSIPASQMRIVNGGGSTVTSPLALSASAATPYTAYWTAAGNIATSTNGFIIRISANDGQLANATGTAMMANITLDTIAPTGNYLTFDAGVAGMTNSASVTVSKSADFSATQYRLSVGASMGDWTNIAATTTAPWTFDPAITQKAISMQLRDIYGNYGSVAPYDGPTPIDPSTFFIQDVTKLNNNDYRLYIGWAATTTASFASYKVEYATSTDGSAYGAYALVTSITSPATTYFVHAGLNPTLYYKYRISVVDIAGNISVRSGFVAAKPDGVQNFGEGGGGSVATAATVDNIAATQNMANGTVSVSYTLTDASAGNKTNASYEGYVFYTTGTAVATTTASTITVSDAAHLPTSGFIQIGNEVIGYGTKTGNVLSGLTRGTWPTPATTRNTRQNASIFANTPVWIMASSTKTSIQNTSIATGQNGYIIWDTRNELTLAGTIYSNVGMRVLVHDNQSVTSGPISTQSDQSNDGIVSTLDLSAPILSFVPSSASVAEDVIATTTITVELSKPYALPVSVNYTIGGTAVSGVDYAVTSTTGVLSIPSDATSTSLDIAPIHDNIYGQNKTVVITLSAPTNATLGQSTFTYTIQEVDFNPTVDFATASSSVAETVGTTTIALNIANPSNTDISLPITAEGTAVAGTNYILPSSTVTLPAGAMTASFDVTVLHDPAYGAAKTLTLALASTTGMTLGTSTTYTLTINEADNAAPEIGTIAAEQVASSTDTNFEKVVITYTVRDTNANSGTVNPSFITPSFEYNTGLGWNSITNLRAEDMTNKAVAEDVYAPYVAVWDAQAQLGSIAVTNVQVRVTANDNEPLNGIGRATSNSFAFDRQAPQVGQFKFDARTGTLTISITDANVFAYTISNNEDMSADGVNATSGSSTMVEFGALTVTMPWTVSTSTYPSIYIVATDVFGNRVSNLITIPGKPQDFAYNDTSDVKNEFFKELISWLPYVSTSSVPFASYDIYRSVDGGEFALRTTKTDSNDNYFVDAGLASSSSYAYRMTITDTHGNVSPYSETITDTPDGQGQTDLVAPVLSSVAAVTVRNTSAIITWETNEIADAVVEYSTSATSDFAITASSTGLVTDHSVTLIDLEPNTEYIFRVRSTDPAGNASAASGSIAFTTTGGPIIGEVASAAADRAVTITWKTNKDSGSTVAYSHSSNFAGSSEVTGTVEPVGDASTTNVFAHTVSITGLDAGTTYYYKVRSTDNAGSETIDDNNGSFYTFQTLNDTYAPTISDIAVPLVSPESIVVFWKTNELSTSQVEYDKNSASTFANLTALDTTLSIYHSVLIANLSANTTYNYKVHSKDVFGNEAISTSTTFTTAKEGEVKIVTIGSSGAGLGQFTTPPEPKDTTPPVISNFEIATTTAFGATVSFDTNEPTVGFLRYGKDATYGMVAGHDDFMTHHEFSISGLRMGTEYHFQMRAIDKASNATIGDDQIVKTKYVSQASPELKTVEDVQQYEKEIEETIESVLPGILPPFVEEPRVVSVTENTADITWKTNIKSYAVILYAKESDFDATRANPYTGEISHTEMKETGHHLTLVGLDPNTKYHFMVRSFSLPQVVGSSQDMTFTTKASRVSARVLGVKNSSFSVVWATEDAASTIVEYKNVKTGEIQRKIDNNKTKEHEMLVDKLIPATTYEVTVFGYNEKGNVIEGGAPVMVTTIKDVSAPKIANFKVDGALVPGRTDRVQTVVTWTTDELSNSTVYYQEGAGAVGATFANKAEQLDTYTTSHGVILSNLKPGTIYQMKVESVDSAGNKASFGPRTIITPQKGESIFDVIFKNFEETFKFLRGAGQ